jgi:hypothetical protein
MTFFYEIRSVEYAVQNRDGSFPTQNAANCRTRRPKKMKNMRQPDGPNVGRMMVGQNAEKGTRSTSYYVAQVRSFRAQISLRTSKNCSESIARFLTLLFLIFPV